MSYAVAGRIWLGAITALSSSGGQAVVTGGAELKGVRGQVVQARFGLTIEVQKDDVHFDTMLVDDADNYPHVLIPCSTAENTDFDIIRSPYRQSGARFRRPATGMMKRLPSTRLLVVPDDPASANYLWIPAAKLGPQSSDLLLFDEVDPMTMEFVEFVPAEDSAFPFDMDVGTLAEIAAIITAGLGGGGGED
ncbi:MAG: hypothetical protein IT464_12735 [Planctomycetes bacterium]|nr:hypothetical protein [Planctomycetota bacterium]